MKKRSLGILFILLSLGIVSVSAFVYQQSSQTVSQTIKEIASITLQNSALGNLEEGQTLYYTPTNQSDLDQIVDVTTTKDNVYLHFDSDLNLMSGNYTTYNIVVKVDTAPGTSSLSAGDTVCTLSIASPDYSSVTLDKLGNYKFDFEITTTAQSVDSDQNTTVNITVNAESTS
jgi:hypothetical protein